MKFSTSWVLVGWISPKQQRAPFRAWKLKVTLPWCFHGISGFSSYFVVFDTVHNGNVAQTWGIRSRPRVSRVFWAGWTTNYTLRRASQWLEALAIPNKFPVEAQGISRRMASLKSCELLSTCPKNLRLRWICNTFYLYQVPGFQVFCWRVTWLMDVDGPFLPVHTVSCTSRWATLSLRNSVVHERVRRTFFSYFC